MLVNFVRHLDWAMGCPDILTNIILGVSVKVFWMKLIFTLVKQNALPDTSGPHSVNWRPVVVQSLSRVWLSVTPWTAARQASLSFAISGSALNSCRLIPWCHPTISSSVAPFSSCSQSFPTSGSFPMSGLFASGGPSIGASASASVLPMNIQDWFPLGLTSLISLLSWLEQKPGLPSNQKESLLPDCLHAGTLAFYCLYWLELKQVLSLNLEPAGLWTRSVPLVPSVLRPLLGLELRWLSWESGRLADSTSGHGTRQPS